MRDTMRGSFYLWTKIADNIYHVEDEFGSRYEDKNHNVIDKSGNFIMDRNTFVKELIEKQIIEKKDFKPIVNLIGLIEFIENPKTQWILTRNRDTENLPLIKLQGALSGFYNDIEYCFRDKKETLYLFAQTDNATVMLCHFNNFNQLPEVIKFLMTTNWIHSTLNIF
jgi:hypothetical protein